MQVVQGRLWRCVHAIYSHNLAIHIAARGYVNQETVCIQTALLCWIT